MLKDKCRSEKWEMYLYCDMTIKVVRAHVQFLVCGDMPVVATTGGRWAEVSAVAVHGVTGRLFWAVYTGTRPGVSPPSGRGRGGGDAGSLLPGVLPPN